MMRAVWARLRAEFRSRWLAWLALAAMIGLLGGAVLASVAGASRTNSSYARFLERSRAWDALTFYAAFDPSFAHLRHAEVSQLEPVSESVEGRYFELEGETEIVATADESFGRTFNRAKLLEGRLPHLDAVDEISIPHDYARQTGLSIGDPYTARIEKRYRNGRPNGTVDLTFEVVGIHLLPGDFPPGTEEQSFAFPSPAFLREHGKDLFSYRFGMFRLDGGVDAVPELRAGIEGLVDGKVFFLSSQQEQTRVADEALDLLTVGLLALAVVLVFVGVLVFGQTLARQTAIDSDGFSTIRALGMTGGQLLTVGLLRSAFIGIAAAAFAVVTAILLSPLTPIGIARLVEPDPGVHLDPLVLVLGALGVIVACIVLSVIPGWRAQRQARTRADEPLRRSRIAGFVFRSGATPSIASGVRLALERGRGTGNVPVLTAIGAAAAGLGAVLLAATFASSLDYLLGHPSLYGVSWEHEVLVDTDGFRAGDSPAYAFADRVRKIDGVADAAVMDLGIPLEVDGISASGATFDPAHRDLAPALTAGRDPLSDDEIVVGELTLQRLGRSIGDMVTVGIAGIGEATYEIVGTAAMPGFVTSDGLGEGTLVLPAALQRLVGDPPPPASIYLRFDPGVDEDAILERIASFEGVEEMREPPVPNTIGNLQRVKGLPWMLAGLLAVIAVAAIVHALLSSVRRRARELAVLRALGFVRRQVMASVAWQAVTLIAVALLFGIPAGIIAGRAVWAVAADELGVRFLPQIPGFVLGVIAPAAIALALLVSAWPARRAARTHPATVLRAE